MNIMPGEEEEQSRANGVELGGLRFKDAKATAERLAKLLWLMKREEMDRVMSDSQMREMRNRVCGTDKKKRDFFDNRMKHYETLREGEELRGIWDVAMNNVNVHLSRGNPQYAATWDPDHHLMERLRENLGLGEEDTAYYQRIFYASRDHPDVAIAWRVLCTAYEALHRKEIDCFRQTYPNCRNREGDKFTSQMLVAPQTRDTALEVAQSQALAHLDPENKSTGMNVSSNYLGGHSALHYQKGLLTMTIMEDENGSLLRPPTRDRPGLSQDFLRVAVFGHGPWNDLSRDGFRDGDGWNEVTGILLELPQRVIDNMCPALYEKRVNHIDADLAHLEKCLFDFLRLLPWHDEYGLPLDE